jgi:hypothetical protein
MKTELATLPGICEKFRCHGHTKKASTSQQQRQHSTLQHCQEYAKNSVAMDAQKKHPLRSSSSSGSTSLHIHNFDSQQCGEKYKTTLHLHHPIVHAKDFCLLTQRLRPNNLRTKLEQAEINFVTTQSESHDNCLAGWLYGLCTTLFFPSSRTIVPSGYFETVTLPRLYEPFS